MASPFTSNTDLRRDLKLTPENFDQLATWIDGNTNVDKFTVYNVKDYGALGDNSQNDAPYIQEAIDDAAANPRGGTVYIPPGEYSIRTGLVLPRNGYPLSNLCGNVKIIGAGTNATTLSDSGYLASNTPMIRYASTPTLQSVANLELRSMTIARSSDGRVFEHAKPTGDVVYERIIRCTLQDLYLRSRVATADPAPTHTVLHIEGGIQVQILNVGLDGGALAAKFLNCSHMMVWGMYTGVDTYAQAGVEIDGGGNNVFHMRVEGTNGGPGIKLTGNTNNNLLIGPTFEGKLTNPQIDLDACNNTVIQNMAIAASTGSGTVGLRCRAGAYNVKAVGGIIGDHASVGGKGIQVDSGARHIDIDAVHFYGGVGDNISIHADSFNVRIAGFTGSEPEERRVLTGGTVFGTLSTNGSSVREFDRYRIPSVAAFNLDTLIDGYTGQELTLTFADNACTVRHNGGGSGNIRLAAGANFASSANDVLRLIFDGTNWLEVSRSANS